MATHTHCQREFQPKNFGFYHKKPVLFVTPQFGTAVFYPVWTGVLLLYHVVALAVDAFQTYDAMGRAGGEYFLYLPNWAYLLLTISAIVDFSVTLYVHCKATHILVERDSKQSDVEIIMRNKAVKLSYKTMGEYYKITWYLKLAWAFFTTASVTGITVSALYWTMHFVDIFPSFKAELLNEEVLDFGSLAFHAVNFFVIVLHILITAKPFRILHFYLPMSFLAVYLLFTAIYFGVSGDYVYTVTDWGNTFVRIGPCLGVVVIFVPVVHALVYLLVQLRTWVGEKCRLRYKARQWKTTQVVPEAKF